MTLHKKVFAKKLTKLIPRLRRYAIVLTRSKENADDLLQSTLERALSKQHQWQQDTHLDRWAFTIMSSSWKNECRHNSIRFGNGLDSNIQDIIDSCSSPSKEIERTFLYAQVFKEVMALSKDHREAILLVYIEGLKYQEAADILSVPLGTLMSRLARARIILADMFSEKDVNDDDKDPMSNASVINLYKHRG